MSRKKKPIIVDTAELSDYVMEVRHGLEDMMNENVGIFGDDDLYRQLKIFNSLEDWEKNLFIMYIYFGSINALHKYVNITSTYIYAIIYNIMGRCRIINDAFCGRIPMYAAEKYMKKKE